MTPLTETALRTHDERFEIEIGHHPPDREGWVPNTSLLWEHRRTLAKARLRLVRQTRCDVTHLAEELLIAPDALLAALSAPYFGTAWAQVQNLSPVLHRRRLRVADLPGETRHACWLREELLQRPFRQTAPEDGQKLAI